MKVRAFERYSLMLSNWTKQWLVKLNLLKSEAALFTLKNIEALPQFRFDNTIVNFVDDHKHLSITFSSNGQWHTHIENITIAAKNY